jgi:antirestriction protein ArdC
MSNKVYEIVNAKILEALEQGNVPWKKPWVAGIPRNAFSNRQYTGINSILLNLAPYSDPRWATMKQINQHGGKVRKGERSSLVVFWKMQDVTREADDGEVTEKQIPLLRYYLCWNVEQCDGLTLPALETRQVDVIAEAEAIIANMPNPPSISYDGGDRAYYIPAKDQIHLPRPESFTSNEERYATTMHELSHSTGHESRLNRKTLTETTHFGSEVYSREELAAEHGAAYLMAHAGIETTIQNSAAYIQGWLRALKNDPKMVVIAASQGQKAAEYIIGNTD